MAEVILNIPGRVHFGSDVLNLVGSIASEFGSRALLLADYNLHEGRHIERVIDLLHSKGIQCILIDDLGSYGSSRTISDTVEFAKTSRIEIIIAMGGGSTLNTGRSIASRYRGTAHHPEAGGSAYLEILTVFRYPFMLRSAYIAMDPGVQRLNVFPMPSNLYKGTLIDPGIMAGISTKYTGTLLMDTLFQALEGFLSSEGNFMTETLFRGALSHGGEGLNEALRGEKSLKPRVKATQSGVLSALGYSILPMGPAMALSYTLNKQFDIPKSWIGTVLLPHLADTYEESHPELLAEAAKLIGEDTFGLSPQEAAASFSNRIRRFLAVLGLPTRLRDFDLKLPRLVEAAEEAAGLNSTLSFHVPFSVDSLYDFLKRAF
ncbi:MAG: iron-containing alcohol dehydrogenase [Spirochaetes bacterium]|nr:iron-containing alcohol dehydrogenase [Spirochaetota bacterium]